MSDTYNKRLAQTLIKQFNGATKPMSIDAKNLDYVRRCILREIPGHSGMVAEWNSRLGQIEVFASKTGGLPAKKLLNFKIIETGASIEFVQMDSRGHDASNFIENMKEILESLKTATYISGEIIITTTAPYEN